MAVAAILGAVASLAGPVISAVDNSQGRKAAREAQLQDRTGIDTLDSHRDTGSVSYLPIIAVVLLLAIVGIGTALFRRKGKGG